MGRVVSSPKAQETGPEGQYYTAEDDDAACETTRVTIRIQPCELIPKDRVAAIEAMREHPIIRVPMGTFFACPGRSGKP